VRGIALAIIGLTLILNMRLGRLDPDPEHREKWKKIAPTVYWVNLLWFLLTIYNVALGW
jgi:hypothetical protein